MRARYQNQRSIVKYLTTYKQSDNPLVPNWTLLEMADFSEPKAKIHRTDLTCKDLNILDLPCEILLKIFWMLPIFDIHRGVAIVCKRFLHITRLPDFFQLIDLKTNEDIPISKEQKLDYKNKFINMVHSILGHSPHCKFNVQVTKNKIPIGDLGTIASSIKKLSMESEFASGRDWYVVPLFENVEELRLINSENVATRIQSGYGNYYLQRRDIWTKFPKLTSLEIHAGCNNDVSYKFECTATCWMFCV